MTEIGERRQQPRVPLRCPLCLHPAEGQIETETTNVSSRGFYCYSPRSFVPGEVVTCLLHIPNWARQPERRFIVVRCSAEVVRVECMAASDGFGVGFVIRDYALWGEDSAPVCM